MADTYTIQFRRGMYADFDTSKIRPGEPVAILGNDPSVPSGKALYIAFAANDVRRLCSIEDISEMVNAGKFVGPQGPKGEKGDKGDPGEKGADGTVAFESLTPGQKESLRGISVTAVSIDIGGNLIITFSDGDSENVGNIIGPQGAQGPKGDKGVGIKKITDYYALSSSNTDKAFGQVWLTTPPTMTAEKKYLWHWQRTDYTDGSFYSTEKGVVGVYGDPGPQGEKGSDATVPIATVETLGKVKPDGKTIFIDADGTLHAKGGITVTPKPVNNPTIENANESVVIKWQDPENTVISGSTFSTWAGTKLVMSETGYPANPDDGTLVVDNTMRDKYKTTGYTVTGLTNGKQYYFALFPYSTDGVYNYDAGNRLLGEPDGPLKIVTFADGTDAEIEKMIEAHYAGKINIGDYWAVGDKRVIHHNAMDATGVSESHKANDYVYIIIGIEHDDLLTAINGKTKAAITIQTERMLYLDTTTEYNSSYDTSHECGYMNSSSTNNDGWEGCARRVWCNTVYKGCLPTYIQNMMKQVKKLTSVGNKISTIKTSNDYAFLPSEIEIFGSTTYSFTGEGEQYQYFKNAAANRYKKPRYSSDYVSGYYWERSPRSDSSKSFCYVNISGNASTYNAGFTHGVAPCLCF